jgi:tetratricopeptide (TPR) repeat protein
MKPTLMTLLAAVAVAAAAPPGRADDPKRYIILEVASSAVRVVAVDLPAADPTAKPAFYREIGDLNLANSADGPDGMKVYPQTKREVVAQAVAQLHKEATDASGGKTIVYGLFMSSGAAGKVTKAGQDEVFDSVFALNLPGLDKQAREPAAVGKRPRVSVNTPEDEVRLSFFGAVPPAERGTALVLDIGGGDTKFGYIEPDTTDQKKTIGSVSVGTKFVLGGMTDAERQQKKDDLDKLTKEVETLIVTKFGNSDRGTVYVTGGIGWAFVGLEKPDVLDSGRALEITDKEVGLLAHFFETIGTKPAPDPKDDTPAAKKAADAIKNVFKGTQLKVGAGLLEKSLIAFRAYKADNKPRKLVFVHDSLFNNLVGYANELAATPAKAPDQNTGKEVTAALKAITDKLDTLDRIEKALAEANKKQVDLAPVTKAIADGFKEVVEELKKLKANGQSGKVDLGPVLGRLDAIEKKLAACGGGCNGPCPPTAPGKLDPAVARGNFVRGMELLLCQPDRALAHFQAALRADDTDPATWYAVALAHCRLGRADDLKQTALRLACFQLTDPLVLAALAPTFERHQGCERAAVEAAVRAARDDMRLASAGR